MPDETVGGGGRARLSPDRVGPTPPPLPLPLSLSLSPTSADGPGSLPSYSLQGPQPLTLSTLECVHAALQTLPHIKDSLKKSFAPRSFPSSLVLQLGTLITALPASASSLKAGNISGSPERSLALKALLDVTGAAASGSGSWIDEGHGLSLLSIARDLAMHASSGPRELEGASWITASVALGIIALPSASKQGAQAAIELARLSVRTREAGLSSSNKWPITRQYAGLLLTECLLKQLAACTNSSGLLSLSSPATFKALQEGSQPGLLLITGGSTSSSTTATSTTVPTLLASSDAFVSNPETETRAKGGVDAARKAPALSISTVASALESSEVLKKDQLSSLLSEPSSDILQVTDRDCARVDLSKVVELFCDDEGEVGLNSIALTLKV